MRELQDIAIDVETAHQCPVPMDRLTHQQYREFYIARKCHISEKLLESDRVRDHCHLTGKYRGAAHSNCNLEFQDSKTISVVFHNLSAYDGHLLVEELATSGKLRVIPNNSEQYIAMIHTTDESKIKFKFLDSFRFTASSLDKLASYLEEHPILENYLYDICSWEKLIEAQLPPMEAFHNDLANTPINIADYEHAQSVWRKFECGDLG